MRTPNTSCLLCKKPLYRRPADMAKARYAACMHCRSEAQKVAGITERQQSGLRLGRPKGTNHRAGYKHREESKRKIGESNRAFWAAHPELAVERGAKTRGELSHNWKGGLSRLSTSIRQMHENRLWMDAIKVRDGACVRCGSTEALESHHEPPFSELIARLGIRSRDDARRHAAILWDLDGGFVLCERCHYAEHGKAWVREHRTMTINDRLRRCLICSVPFLVRPSVLANGGGKYCSRTCCGIALRTQKGARNPNYRGGKVPRTCLTCAAEFSVKPATAKGGGGKFCSRECTNAYRRKDLRTAA